MDRRVKIFTFLLALAVFALVIIGTKYIPFPSKKSTVTERTNILLITIDALRADHLGCYGNKSISTPTIDLLAKNSIIFTNAICQFPKTTPSHASILTGRYPLSHGVLDNCWILDNKEITLPEILKKYKYTTAAFVSSHSVTSDKTNLNQGFDIYNDELPDKIITRDVNERIAENTISAVSKWLLDNYEKKFFIWIHIIDPHGPYIPLLKNRMALPKYSFNKKIELGRSNYGKKIIPEYQIINKIKDMDYYISSYDGEIMYVDHWLGKLFSMMKEKRCFENTMIIFTADHGESMGEHDLYFQHGSALYQEQLRIPLIIKYPDSKHILIDNLVQSIDIMPTILDYLKIDIPKQVQGKSLLSLANLKSRNNFSNIGFAYLKGESGGEYCIIENGWKLIIDSSFKEKELYNLNTDKKERSNLLNDMKFQDIRKGLKQKLIKQVELSKSMATPTKVQKIDEESIRKLRALGYL